MGEADGAWTLRSFTGVLQALIRKSECISNKLANIKSLGNTLLRLKLPNSIFGPANTVLFWHNIPDW